MSNDYKSILTRLLDRIPNTLDKRQGSIIYDALAPAAMELAEAYADIDVYYEQTYLKTATGENLDNRVADYGLTRNPATYAIRTVEVYNTSDELYDIPVGSRFSIPSEDGGYNYELIEKIDTGKYKAQCETAGTVGNQYIGVLLPLYNITGLGRAEIVGTFQAAEDIENDEDLRARAMTSLNNDAFGGNVADYKRYMNSIDGVGGVKVFPIWDGGGTVKISFVNSDNTIPSNDFKNEVQTLIDPTTNSGEGLGMAPIGHTVTVVTPTAKNLTISATLELDSGYVLSSLEDEITQNISEYIEEVKNSWANTTTLKVYISRIIAEILRVQGVSNVTLVKINNVASDLTLTETATTQEFPILEEVVLNENS